MVTSGKSARRCPSTSPMLMSRSPRVGSSSPGVGEFQAAADAVIASALVGARSCHEDEAELADLDLVAVAEGGRLDPFAVHVRAVEAADVADGEGAALAVELGVPAGDGHVVEED